MKGLRTQENDKFMLFFGIVQNAAQKKGCIFYLDAGDGREFETDVLEGEDLMGWLIPKGRATEFEKEWLSDDISDDWSDFYLWAVWDNPNDLEIKFKTS